MILSAELNKETEISSIKKEHLNLIIKNFAIKDLGTVIEITKSMLLNPDIVNKEDLEIIDNQIEKFLEENNEELEEWLFDRINLEELHLEILKLKLDEFRYKKKKHNLGLLYEMKGDLSKNSFKIESYEKAIVIYKELGLTNSKIQNLRLKISLQNLN